MPESRFGYKVNNFVYYYSTILLLGVWVIAFSRTKICELTKINFFWKNLIAENKKKIGGDYAAFLAAPTIGLCGNAHHFHAASAPPWLYPINAQARQWEQRRHANICHCPSLTCMAIVARSRPALCVESSAPVGRRWASGRDKVVARLRHWPQHVCRIVLGRPQGAIPAVRIGSWLTFCASHNVPTGPRGSLH